MPFQASTNSCDLLQLKSPVILTINHMITLMMMVIILLTSMKVNLNTGESTSTAVALSSKIFVTTSIILS